MINRNEALQEFERTLAYARLYIRDNQEEFKTRYEGRYLAIALNEGVIDSDEDRISLIRRLQVSNDKRSMVIDNIINLTKPKLSNN